MIRLPLVPGGLRRRRAAPLVARGLAMAFLSYAAMLAFAAFALPNGNLEHILCPHHGGVPRWSRALPRLEARRPGPRADRGAARRGDPLVIWLYPASHSGDYWLAPALGVFVAALATATGPLVRWLSRPLMLRAGEASYCLYLTHCLLRDVVAGLSDWGRQSWFMAIPATVAIVLALGGAAYALHRLVEVPARRLLHARAS